MRSLGLLALVSLQACGGAVPVPPAAPVGGHPVSPTAAHATAAAILVPAELDDSDDLDALRTRIDAAVADAAHGQPAEVVVYAATTLTYGCSCPTFVLAPFQDNGNLYVMPLPVAGLADPAPLAMPLGFYRFRGHLDGRTISGLDWIKERHSADTVSPEEQDEWTTPSPAFVLADWCYEPPEAWRDADDQTSNGAILDQIVAAGRLCPGSVRPPPFTGAPE